MIVLVPDFRFLRPFNPIFLMFLFLAMSSENLCNSKSVNGLSPRSISSIWGFSLMNLDKKSKEVKFLPFKESFLTTVVVFPAAAAFAAGPCSPASRSS